MGCRVLVLTAVVLLSVESNNGAHQPILIGTVQLLSAKDKSSTSDIWAGYKLWEEHTNLQGGIRVGNVTRAVELRMYHSSADGIRPVDLYKRLVEDDKVDFLFIGDSGSSRDLSDIASPHGIISILSSHESNFYEGENHSLQYAIHRKDTKLSTEKFIRDVRSTWGLTRMALVWVEGTAAAASSLDGTSFASAQQCKGLQEDVNEGRLEGTIVLAEQLVDGQYSQTMARVDAAGADVLVACIDNETQARSIMHAAAAAGILIGWPGQAAQVQPLLVASSSLKFIHFTAAADIASFASTLGGWVQRIVSASPWQRELSLSDPQFGSAASLEELWQDRVDYGNGRRLPAAAAAAIATGVVLRMAVEAAGSVETERVARALEELDSETVFGRVKFGADGWNTAPGGALVQWDCTMANKTECGKLVWPVIAGQDGAAGAGSGVLQPLHPKCPEGETWLDVEPVVDLQYAPDPARGGLPGEYLTPSYCIACSSTDMMWSWNLLKDTDAWNNFAKICADGGQLGDSGFAGEYKVGMAVMAGPGDEEWRLALPAFQLLYDWLKTIGIGFLPYTVHSVDASDVGLGDEASKPAIRAAMAEVREAVGAQSPRWFIWNSGLVRFAASDVPVFPGPKCPGGGVQLSWDDMALCVQPALRLQGRVVARLLEHFAWRRCHVVLGRDEEYQEVWREFSAVSSGLGIQVESQVTVPAEGGTERWAALDAVAQLDDCRATVVVLLLGRHDAQAVFERVYGREAWAGDRRFVVVGVEAAGRAGNAPEGMLAVRTVAQAENLYAQQVMSLSGDARPWGTGVEVEREAEGGATGAEPGQAGPDAWLDIGVEDQRLFVAEALVVLFSAGIVVGGAGVFEAPLNDPDTASAGVLGLADFAPIRSITADQFNFEAQTDPVTGHLRFDRANGRFAFVNKQQHGWVSLAYIDLYEKYDGPIVHAHLPDFGQVAWEREAVEWGRGARASGAKPSDTCDCVVWSKLGPYSRVSECRWSEEAMAMLGLGAAMVVLAGGVVWRRTRKHKDEVDLCVRKRIQELRLRLRMRRQDGFLLSTERPGFLASVDERKIVHVKHLEALARLTLFLDFEVRAVDSLALVLENCDRQIHPAAAMAHTGSFNDLTSSHLGSENSAQYTELRNLLLEVSAVLLDPSPGQDDASEAVSSFNLKSSSPLFQTRRRSSWAFARLGSGSRRLSFHYPAFPSAALGIQSRSPPGSPNRRPRSPLRSPIRRLRSPRSPIRSPRRNSLAPPRLGSPYAVGGQVRRLSLRLSPLSLRPSGPFLGASTPGRHRAAHARIPALRAELGLEEAGEWSPSGGEHYSVGSNQGGSWAGNARPGSAANSSQDGPDLPLATEVMDSVDSRFHFFSTHVAQLSVFRTDRVLFKELKRGVVQQFMDRLRAACDRTFESMLLEAGAQELVNFNVNPLWHPRHPPLALRTDQAIRVPDTTASAVGADSEPLLPASLAGDDNRSHRDHLAPQATPHAGAPGPSGPTLPDAPLTAVLDSDSSQALAGAAGQLEEIVRQDHPRVRAIRMTDEDLREGDLEVSLSQISRSESGDSTTTMVEGSDPLHDEEAFISQLYKRAVLLNGEFQARLRTAVEQRFEKRVQVCEAPVKSKARMREKLRSYVNPAVWTSMPDVSSHGVVWAASRPAVDLPLSANILDPIRATVVCDGPGQMLKVARWLLVEGERERLSVVRVKNKFADRDSSDYDGYRDLMLCVLYTGSHNLNVIGEIQIHDRRLHALKLKMHKLYKVKRATMAANIM